MLSLACGLYTAGSVVFCKGSLGQGGSTWAEGPLIRTRVRDDSHMKESEKSFLNESRPCMDYSLLPCHGVARCGMNGLQIVL